MKRPHVRLSGWDDVQPLGVLCLGCGAHHDVIPNLTTCSLCRGNLDITYDYAHLRKKLDADGWPRYPGIWRYRPLLPLRRLPEMVSSGRSPVFSRVGGTPLSRFPILEESLGLSSIWLKDDTVLPSGSFKDRASAVAMARGWGDGGTVFATASTGNAGASLACLCAATGTKSVILVPEGAPRGKLAQLGVYGCHLVVVQGNYDAAFDLCMRLDGIPGVTVRSTGMNPFTREGKKTVSLEIFSQLRRPPSWVIVPVGDGNILSGTWKGFHDLFELGKINRMPRLAAIQAEGSSSIAQAFNHGRPAVEAVSADTLADSISVDFPRDGQGALHALRKTNGVACTVSDAEILDSQRWLASRTGLYVEPAAAASIAGLRSLVHQGVIERRDSVVVLLTGTGLKDVEKTIRATVLPTARPPDAEGLRREVERIVSGE